VVILTDRLNSLLLDKTCVVLEHLGDVFYFLVLIVSVQLYSCETDQLSCFDMLPENPVNADEALSSRLIIISVVDRDPCVSLPDKEALRHSLTLLSAHGIDSSFRVKVDKL